MQWSSRRRGRAWRGWCLRSGWSVLSAKGQNVTGKQLLGSRWTCPSRSAKFKPQKTFDFVDVDMCNLYLIICFSSITFSYLSVETDVRNVVSATSVKFDCKTKTWRYDKSDSISALKYIFLHTHSHGRRPGVRHPAFQGLFLSYRITSQHRSSQSETQTSSHLHGKILILEITKEGNGSKKSARWERDREREGRRR